MIERLRQHEPELKAAGIVHLHVFGSVARDEAMSFLDLNVPACNSLAFAGSVVATRAAAFVAPSSRSANAIATQTAQTRSSAATPN